MASNVTEERGSLRGGRYAYGSSKTRPGDGEQSDVASVNLSYFPTLRLRFRAGAIPLAILSAK